MITFRDKDVSMNRLKEIGVSTPIMQDAADDAMTIPAIGQASAWELLAAETGWSGDESKRGPLVAMNLKGSLKLFKGLDRSGGLEKETALMARIADELIQAYGAKILFLPTDYNPDVDDRMVHRDVLARMSNGNAARSVEGEYSDAELKGLLGLADGAIGARYHFVVFAASQRVPFLGMASGVYQQTKLKGLAALCGLPQCSVEADMEFAEFDDVWPQVVDLMENRDSIRRQLGSIVPKLEDRSAMAVKEAVRLLRL
jgi:polysaccharide pyruvyl transferase WcaK-like protein